MSEEPKRCQSRAMIEKHIPKYAARAGDCKRPAVVPDCYKLGFMLCKQCSTALAYIKATAKAKREHDRLIKDGEELLRRAFTTEGDDE